ncbi:YggT family protein [Streptococcus mutans]|uniref:YggT family protein n=1 Tax=Streptococcus mutans TaxID=1309 RepID=UPI0002F7A077|nr:YggT family protein [Streptococcus mutans]NLQ55328.1 YggT family protein [Streptococcus mutans]
MVMAYVVLILARVVDIYSFLLVIYALLSWFPNAYDTWLGKLLVDIVEPIIKPFRRFDFQFTGLDFKIIVILLLLQLLKRFLFLLLI